MQFTNWGDEKCGFQTRDCFDVNNCNSTKEEPVALQVCLYTEDPACYDGIKNCHDGSCEILVDCGGPCPPCPTCSDGIRNQGEENIDCGGPCPACIPEKPLVKKSYRYILIVAIILLLIIIALRVSKTLKMKKAVDDLLAKKHKQTKGFK